MNQSNAAFDAEVYLAQAEDVCQLMLAHPKVMADSRMEGREGCCIYTASIEAPDVPLCWEPVGDPGEKIDKYRSLAREKPLRLARYGQLYSFITLSYLCRNESAGEWGGAILGSRLLHAISGWPQDVDELHAAANAVRCGDLSLKQALAILASRKTIPQLSFGPLGRVAIGSVAFGPMGSRALANEPNPFADCLPDLV